MQALREVLTLLAADPVAQIAHIDDIRATAEQLRDGVVELAPIDRVLERRGALAPATASAVRRIDALFDAMMEAEEDLFTEHGIRHADAWAEIRQAAARALEGMDRRGDPGRGRGR